MYCANCGFTNNDGGAFCSRCGAPLDSMSNYGYAPTQVPTAQPTSVNVAPRRNQGLIVALCVLLILTIGVGAFALITTSKSAGADSTRQTGVVKVEEASDKDEDKDKKKSKKSDEDASLVLIIQNFISMLYGDATDTSKSTSKAAPQDTVVAVTPVVERVVPYLSPRSGVYEQVVREISNVFVDNSYTDNSYTDNSYTDNSSTTIIDYVRTLIENPEVVEIDEDTYRVIAEWANKNEEVFADVYDISLDDDGLIEDFECVMRGALPEEAEKLFDETENVDEEPVVDEGRTDDETTGKMPDSTATVVENDAKDEEPTEDKNDQNESNENKNTLKETVTDQVRDVRKKTEEVVRGTVPEEVLEKGDEIDQKIREEAGKLGLDF